MRTEKECAQPTVVIVCILLLVPRSDVIVECNTYINIVYFHANALRCVYCTYAQRLRVQNAAGVRNV